MRLLIVEEDIEYANDLLDNFNNQYVTDVAYSGYEGTYMSTVNEYDAILVSDVLPDINGKEFCEQIRDNEVDFPVMLLLDTSKSSDYIIQILDSGADDYIYRSNDKKELSAKIRALIRRSKCSMRFPSIEYKNIKLYVKEKTLKIGNNIIDLRRKEYDMLEYLMINYNRVVSKEELLEHVWDKGMLVESNTLEVHMSNLRKKLNQHTLNNFIKTVKGFGYLIRFDI
jgi:two-component system response regulator CiaR